jgi:hypothetical protein
MNGLAEDRKLTAVSAILTIEQKSPPDATRSSAMLSEYSHLINA